MRIIDYQKIKYNIKRLMNDNELILVLKDDAYGFGIDKVYNCARECAIKRFAVNTIDEAIYLRKKDASIEILLFGYQVNSLAFIKEYNILPTISTISEFELYRKNHISMALEIDSGMNRFGFKKLDESILASPYITTIYTHLAKEDEKNYDYIDYIKELSLKYDKKAHIGGSIAYHYTSMPIRIGKAIYEGADSLYGNVVYVHKGTSGEEIGYEGSYRLDHDMNIAIIDVGYSNGIRRDFDGDVYVNKRRAKVIGKVCMNHIYIASDYDIRIGDIVEFYGENISKDEFLCKNFMTNYESFLLIR